MTKVFISQPMSGKTEDEILIERENIIATVNEKYGDEIEVLQSYFEDYDGNAVGFLSKAIEVLSRADVAAFGKGWDNARGCIIEHEVCEKYGIATLEL